MFDALKEDEGKFNSILGLELVHCMYSRINKFVCCKHGKGV